jgi:hypothetical protein
MTRLGLGLLAALVSAAPAWADGLVPPPRGKKYVAVTHSVKLDRDISGYRFFTRPLGLRNNGEFERIELSADKAVTLSRPGKFGIQLVAVPDAVAKKYDTEKELLAALNGKLEGVASARFERTAFIPEQDERRQVTVEHIITGFDAGKGIQMKDSSDMPKSPGKQAPALAPAGVAAVSSGLALTLAFATGGLWLVRRRGTGGTSRRQGAASEL